MSLLPSATEIAFALGLGDDLVGVTFECDFPPAARSKRIVSTSGLADGLTPGEIDAVVKERMAAGDDLYHLDAGALGDLDPELVLTQDLCAVCAIDVTEVDDALTHLACSAEVVTLDPMTLDEVIASIGLVGAATGRRDEADALRTTLRRRLDDLAVRLAGVPRRPTLVLEWTDPAFTAGHWVPDLVEAGGGRSLLGRPGEHSVGVEWDKIRGCDAEVVVVAPCGFGLEDACSLADDVVAADRVPPGAEVWAVDADSYMVRPGPRVVTGAEILAGVLHPGVVGPPDAAAARRIG
ncbi:MAG: cobalamin-binding protein [Actinomycetota bacterium]